MMVSLTLNFLLIVESEKVTKVVIQVEFKLGILVEIPDLSVVTQIILTPSLVAFAA